MYGTHQRYVVLLAVWSRRGAGFARVCCTTNKKLLTKEPSQVQIQSTLNQMARTTPGLTSVLSMCNTQQRLQDQAGNLHTVSGTLLNLQQPWDAVVAPDLPC